MNAHSASAAEKQFLIPYKGSFNVRLTAELHQKAARKSALLGISLNQLVQRAVEKELRVP